MLDLQLFGGKYGTSTRSAQLKDGGGSWGMLSLAVSCLCPCFPVNFPLPSAPHGHGTQLSTVTEVTTIDGFYQVIGHSDKKVAAAVV